MNATPQPAEEIHSSKVTVTANDQLLWRDLERWLDKQEWTDEDVATPKDHKAWLAKVEELDKSMDIFKGVCLAVWIAVARSLTAYRKNAGSKFCRSTKAEPLPMTHRSSSYLCESSTAPSQPTTARPRLNSVSSAKVRRRCLVKLDYYASFSDETVWARLATFQRCKNTSSYQV